MGEYAIWFTYKEVAYRLPVNPEEIKETTTMTVEKYDVLKLGEIAVPGSMNSREFTFETEFQQFPNHYTEEPDNFLNADYFLNLFKTVREKKEPILFTAAYITSRLSLDEVKNISTYVLIESLDITEKAGEEGDKYVSFKLLEYKPFGKKQSDEVITVTSLSTGKAISKKKKTIVAEAVTPKSTGYHIVKSGDSLWSISKKYYGDGGKCNILFNANKDKIEKPAVIGIGWKLKIPEKSEFSKYSAPLPKTITKEPAIPKYNGGISPSGRTHSSGGGSF